jgi:hypothetical protein
MAAVRREIGVDANAEEVWAALGDWGALHERLAPGFVTDTRVDGRDRIVTFFNGNVVRERIVDVDPDERRLSWSIVDGPYAHHNGSAQVFADGERRARFVWTADLLPDELAPGTAEMMDRGLAAIKRALEAAPRLA